MRSRRTLGPGYSWFWAGFGSHMTLERLGDGRWGWSIAIAGMTALHVREAIRRGR